MIFILLFYFWGFFNLMLVARMLAVYKMDPLMLHENKASLYKMLREDPIAMFICSLIFPALFFYMLVGDE